MSKSIEEMTLEELAGFAIDHCIEPCDICRYTDACNHCAINNYGNGPVFAPCCDDYDKWVDEDALREKVKEVRNNAKEGQGL